MISNTIGVSSSITSSVTISSASVTPALPPATAILSGTATFWLPLPITCSVVSSLGGHGLGILMVMGIDALLPANFVLPISTQVLSQVAQP